MSYGLEPVDVLALTVSLCVVELRHRVVDWNSFSFNVLLLLVDSSRVVDRNYAALPSMYWNLDVALPLVEMSYGLDPVDVLVLTVSLRTVKLRSCPVDWNSCAFNVLLLLVA